MLDLYQFPFQAMACANEVQLYAPDAVSAKQHADAIIAEVHRIEAKYSRYRPESVMSQINGAAGGTTAVPVDEETTGLLNYAAALYQESDGLFDITSGVLRQVWNFREAKVPAPQQVKGVLPLIGWPKVQFEGGTIRLSKPGMEIDFGGIGKEYAVDRAVGIAMFRNISGGLVNLGGDVRAFGVRPDQSPWMIGITHPRKKGAVLAALPLTVGSVASSGDYERYFEFNSQRYCHIFNPKTGYPVQGFQSVSVYAGSCLVAGSISTLAMLKEEALGMKYLKETGLPSLAVLQSGEVVRGQGTPRNLSFA